MLLTRSFFPQLDFYRSMIREDGPIEYFTVIMYLMSFVISILLARSFRKERKFFVVFTIFSIGFLLISMEEISWGHTMNQRNQRYHRERRHEYDECQGEASRPEVRQRRSSPRLPSALPSAGRARSASASPCNARTSNNRDRSRSGPGNVTSTGSSVSMRPAATAGSAGQRDQNSPAAPAS